MARIGMGADAVGPAVDRGQGGQCPDQGKKRREDDKWPWGDAPCMQADEADKNYKSYDGGERCQFRSYAYGTSPPGSAHSTRPTPMAMVQRIASMATILTQSRNENEGGSA